MRQINPLTGEVEKPAEQSLLDDWKIKQLVQEYFEDNNSGFASRIAKAMNLKWADTTAALKELHSEGLLKRSQHNHSYRRID